MDSIKKRRIILLVIVALLFLVIVLSVIISAISNVKTTTESTEEDYTIDLNTKVTNMEKYKLSNMKERDRIEYYVTNFIKMLEYGAYEDAYAILNSEFKNNFFPTLESFEQYAKKRFYKNNLINYDNIERAGDIYVIWADISNLLGKTTKKDDINFVIKENDLNDYELSFSVNRK